jgi:hypothetical protein
MDKLSIRDSGSARSLGAGSALTSVDVARHEALGIPRPLLEQANVRRLDDRHAREILGICGKAGDFSGVEYPYIDPRTSRRVTSRVRLDRPALKPDGSPDGKYRTPYGDNRHLFFPPGAGRLLADAAVPAVVVEAEKSALAITAAAARAGRSILVVACGGCWAWRGRIGKTEDASGARVDEKGPLPDFGLIAWTGRQVVILFDARPNDSVQAARRALGRELAHRGAEVRHARLPDHDSSVNGPDDLIAVQGDGALWRVLDGASVEEFRRRGSSGAIVAEDLDNDAFAQQVVIDGAAASDLAIDRLWVSINDTFGFRPSKDTLRTVVDVEAHRSSVHPVCDYLAGLAWDGIPRLDDWLVTYGGAEPSDYVRAVAALPLIAAVRRVRQPGCKFDELLVLEGVQGGLKSSALRALCPDESWFSDDLPLGVDSKHVVERSG